MDLVNDEQTNLLHIGAILPVPGDSVPFLGRANDDVGGQQCAQVGREVSCQLHHLLAQPGAQTLAPIIHAFTHQGLHFVSMMALYSLIFTRMVAGHVWVHTHRCERPVVHAWWCQRATCPLCGPMQRHAYSNGKSLDQHFTEDKWVNVASPPLLSGMFARHVLTLSITKMMLEVGQMFADAALSSDEQPA